MTRPRLILDRVVVGCFEPGGRRWGEEYCSIVVTDWFDHLPPLDDCVHCVHLCTSVALPGVNMGTSPAATAWPQLPGHGNCQQPANIYTATIIIHISAEPSSHENFNIHNVLIKISVRWWRSVRTVLCVWPGYLSCLVSVMLWHCRPLRAALIVNCVPWHVATITSDYINITTVSSIPLIG